MVEYLSRQLERAGAAHCHFQTVCEAEFDEHDRPYRQIVTEHVHAAKLVDSFDNSACAGCFHECRAVDYIQAVEHIGMHGHQHGDEREECSLRLISWHK